VAAFAASIDRRKLASVEYDYQYVTIIAADIRPPINDPRLTAVRRASSLRLEIESVILSLDDAVSGSRVQ